MKLQHKIGRWTVLFIIGTVITIFFTGKDGLIVLYNSHRSIVHTKDKIAYSKHQIDSLTTVIQLLKNDTNYIRRIAREKLGMAGKDEKVFKFSEE